MKLNSNRKNVAKIVAAASSAVLLSCSPTYLLNGVEIDFPAVESVRHGLKSNFNPVTAFQNVIRNSWKTCTTVKDKAFASFKDKVVTPFLVPLKDNVLVPLKDNFLVPFKNNFLAPAANIVCKPVRKRVIKPLQRRVIKPLQTRVILPLVNVANKCGESDAMWIIRHHLPGRLREIVDEAKESDEVADLDNEFPEDKKGDDEFRTMRKLRGERIMPTWSDDEETWNAHWYPKDPVVGKVPIAVYA